MLVLTGAAPEPMNEFEELAATKPTRSTTVAAVACEKLVMTPLSTFVVFTKATDSAELVLKFQVEVCGVEASGAGKAVVPRNVPPSL